MNAPQQRVKIFLTFIQTLVFIRPCPVWRWPTRWNECRRALVALLLAVFVAISVTACYTGGNQQVYRLRSAPTGAVVFNDSDPEHLATWHASKEFADAIKPKNNPVYQPSPTTRWLVRHGYTHIRTADFDGPAWVFVWTERSMEPLPCPNSDEYGLTVRDANRCGVRCMGITYGPAGRYCSRSSW
jgi:hypothetical protein